MHGDLLRKAQRLHWAGAGDTRIEVILALTVRMFRDVDACVEWDLRRATAKRDQSRVSGERAYQFIRGGGRPSDFYPCRVEGLIS